MESTNNYENSTILFQLNEDLMVLEKMNPFKKSSIQNVDKGHNFSQSNLEIPIKNTEIKSETLELNNIYQAQSKLLLPEHQIYSDNKNKKPHPDNSKQTKSLSFLTKLKKLEKREKTN